LRFSESFYLATLGGGAFFGKVGSFAPGYEFDALVLDETDMPRWGEKTPQQRLEQYAYLEKGRQSIQAKFVAGEKIL
jgi:guanine deaminase